MLIQKMKIKDAKVIITDGIERHPYTVSIDVDAQGQNGTEVVAKITSFIGSDKASIKERLVLAVKEMTRAKRVIM